MRALAAEAGLDLDEALITLWDEGFEYLNGPGDLLNRGEANRARRALGLATRRELASVPYWCTMLELAEADLHELLNELGVSQHFEGGQLTKRAIHRLKAELKRRRPYHSAAHPSGPAQGTVVTASPPPLTWLSIGHVRQITPLSVHVVTAIHEALVQDFVHHADPIEPPGIRSLPLLESAVGRPLTSIDDTPKYPTVEMAAAALLHALVHDHPFHNGNKRTALVAMLVFLDEHSLVPTCNEDELFKLVLQLAQHALVSGPRHELADREVLYVADWLRSRTRWVEKGDRAIPWRKLRKILGAYGCAFEVPGTVGNRINISREVTVPSTLFRRQRKKLLRTQVAYGDEGREVDKGTINKIRHDLALDDDNGVDSSAFYDRIPMSLSEFIIRYRKTLRRLARL